VTDEVRTGGAWVIFDPYWDPIWAYPDETEARRACEPNGAHPGAHTLWVDDIRPGAPGPDFPDAPRPWDEPTPVSP
jgi:hypothetical protein